jgi:hypothetical protein
MASHVLFKCRFTVRIWNIIKDWLGLVEFDPTTWINFNDVEDWWTTVDLAHEVRKKALASLLMLVTWVFFGKNRM